MKSPHVTRVEVEEAPSNSKKSSDLKTKSNKGINDLDEVDPARANCCIPADADIVLAKLTYTMIKMLRYAATLFVPGLLRPQCRVLSTR